MRIVSNRNLNLHSASTAGGLLHVPAKIPVAVPEDVSEHPLFRLIVKHGVVTILGNRQYIAMSEPVEIKTEHTDQNQSLIPTAQESQVGDPDEDEDEEETSSKGHE